METKTYEINNEEYQNRGLKHIGPELSHMVKEIACRSEHQEGAEKKGITSGLSCLDSAIGGLKSSELILVGARPRMGKTSFALGIAIHVARIYRSRKVAVFSLENSREQLIKRMLTMESGIPLERLITGDVEREDWRDFHYADGNLYSCELYINDIPDITVEEIRAELIGTSDLGLVVIDNLQLLAGDNRVRKITETACSLKSLAKELDVPVIVLTELPEDIDRRSDKRPGLSDLRSYGYVDQYADVVLFLYRESYCCNETKDKEECECIIAKNRFGEKDVVELCWLEQYKRFLYMK